MPFDFNTVVDRHGTNSVKYDFAAENGMPADVLPLWIADMDFPAPPCVREALQRVLDHGIFGYTAPKDSYFQAVVDWFARRHGWQTQKDWIATTPGVVFALSAAIRVMTEPGDGVLILTPVYAPFYRVIRQNGRTVVESALRYLDGKYRIDFADVAQKMQRGVKALILCSPHNPVGRVWTREELQTLGALCARYGVRVISDEIHCDFTLPPHTHTPFLVACPELADSTVVCTAPSKTFNLAGLQIANTFLPGAELRTKFQAELARLECPRPGCMGIFACEAAYTHGEEWLDACRAYLRENLAYLRGFLAENLPDVRLVEPEGTYFAWLDFTRLGLDKSALDTLLTQKAKLWFDTGSMFGENAALFQRVVLACPRATLQNALTRLAQAIREAKV